MDLIQLRKAVRGKRIVWHKHSLEKILERQISRKEVKEVLLKGEIIENYNEDKPFPSALLFRKVKNNPSLHVVVALDKNNDICYIITAYRPDLKHFKKDYKTRIK